MAKANNLIFKVRSEQSSDYKQIDDLLVAAFKGNEEVNIVTGIRKGSDYIKELSLVAEEGGEEQGKILGFNMLSYVTLKNDDVEYRVLSLGPIAVLPEFQSKGIGAVLIKESIRIADDRGDPLIVLLGHPEYYPRFGFERASKMGIFPPAPWPDDHYMVHPLKEYKPAHHGKISYPPAWGITVN